MFSACQNTESKPVFLFRTWLRSALSKNSLQRMVIWPERRLCTYCLIFVSLQDRGNPVSLNSTTTLVIKVEDQSDQPPEFEKSSYRADIPENTTLPVSRTGWKSI